MIIYKSAAPPIASTTTPAEGAVYSQGQTVDASYTCTKGTGGPGLKPGGEGCSGTVAKGAAVETSTPGEHHFTVIATSKDGLSTAQTVSYTVAAPPTASITTPAEGAVYSEGQTVDASYTCTEGTGGPGLKPGSEGCSGTVAKGAAVETSTPGEHHFTVTATSKDGLSTAQTVSYTVSAPSFVIEMEQEIEGSKAGYTKSTLSAYVGETVEYKIIVKNTGNVTLKFGALKDTGCTGLTRAGEPRGRRRRDLHLQPQTDEGRLLHQRSLDRRQRRHRHQDLQQSHRQHRNRTRTHRTDWTDGPRRPSRTAAPPEPRA